MVSLETPHSKAEDRQEQEPTANPLENELLHANQEQAIEAQNETINKAGIHAYRGRDWLGQTPESKHPAVHAQHSSLLRGHGPCLLLDG